MALNWFFLSELELSGGVQEWLPENRWRLVASHGGRCHIPMLEFRLAKIEVFPFDSTAHLGVAAKLRRRPYNAKLDLIIR